MYVKAAATFLTPLILLLVHPSASTTYPYRAAPPVVAAQVFYTPATTQTELLAELKGMRARGVNTVIFRVFHNRGDRVYGLAVVGDGRSMPQEGVYFKTSLSPIVADLLPVFVKTARRAGLNVWVWMTTRDAVYGASPRLLDRRYELGTGRILSIRKLDLFNQDAVERLVGLYGDLASHPIDGILLQDDFAIRHLEAMGPAAAERYRLLYGRLPTIETLVSEYELGSGRKPTRVIHTARFAEWSRHKNRQLIEVAQRIKRAVKRRNPGVLVCFNAPYELYLDEGKALEWYAHSVELAETFDMVAVMAYQRQIARELGLDAKEAEEKVALVAKNAARTHGARRVIVKLQTREWRSGKPVGREELQRIIAKVSGSADGVGIGFSPWEEGAAESVPVIGTSPSR